MMLSLIVQKAVTGVVAVSEIHITSYSNNSICYGNTVNHQTIPVTYLWSFKTLIELVFINPSHVVGQPTLKGEA
jgi:hypothetical protein